MMTATTTAAVATTSDKYRLLIPVSRYDRSGLLHAGRRGTKWTPSKECHGGMGGQEDSGYRSVCDTEWCLPVWSDKQCAGRAMCPECKTIVGPNNMPLWQ